MNPRKYLSLAVLYFILLGGGQLCLSSPDPPGDSPETGLKYFQNYLPSGGDISPQNWSILQDRRGIIYAGNQGALLEYDGVSWRAIRVRNRRVRSMASDNNGNIYIGGYNEIGCFSLQPNGTLTYKSLTPLVPETKKTFSVVWKTHWTGKGIYFRTSKYLFRYNPETNKIKVWEPEPHLSFRTSFTCGGDLYIRQNNTGLTRMTGDTPQLIPGGELFKDKKIYMTVPFKNNPGQLLIGTWQHGLFLYENGQARPFPTRADRYLKTNKLYHGIRLEKSPGQFALATRLGGLVVIDSSGNLKYLFNKKKGLANDITRFVHEDVQGNIWLALNKGIAKIEYTSPFTLYDARTGLPGLVLAVTVHQNRIYAGTSTGIYHASPGRTFFRIPRITTNCWSLLPVGDSLLAATTGGVYHIRDNKTSRITGEASYVLYPSPNSPDRVWLGTGKGLTALQRVPGNKPGHYRWKIRRRFEEISREIRTIAQEPDGTLWLCTEPRGVLQVRFNPRDTTGITITRITPYTQKHGLPNEVTRVFIASRRVIFASPTRGIYRFDAKKNVFVPDRLLGKNFAGGGRGVHYIAPDARGRLWFHSQGWNYRAEPVKNNTCKIISQPFLRPSVMHVNHIYPHPGGQYVWFAAGNGLTRYALNKKPPPFPRFSCRIRQVVIKDTPVLYHPREFRYLEDPRLSGPEGERIPHIPYRDRNLKFHFAAPFFSGETRTLFRCRLDGYDRDWSDWTPVSFKEYTNIDSGVHRFRVQAKNVYQRHSSERVFQFRVLPPWYNTWWAYLFYCFLAFLAVYLIVKLRGRKLELEKQKLEQIVKDRTGEINEKNLLLEEQTHILKDQSEKLRELDSMKSRFFSNISHEFRTPLTLIMGPLEQILNESSGKDQKLEKKVQLMLRNSHRLLALINRLLDLSKLDSGKMKLQAVRQDIVPFIKGIAASFELLASQYRLDLSFHAQTHEIFLYYDPEKMEDVMCNLLANAVKFTPGGGEITVSVNRISPDQNSAQGFPRGCVEISVADTGPGIPREQIGRIFDRFYQSDQPVEQKRRGSGIGLALTRELIHLHRGTIGVHSSEGPGSGTRFVIRLPLGDHHLEPRQIAAAPGTVPAGDQPFQIPAAYIPRSNEAPASPGLSPREEPVRPNKEIILVVEDNADVREYIRGALEPIYRVEEAVDGKEGIEIAKTLIPDLLISDIMMPRVDGFQLCRTLKQNIETSHIPIILLTAKASEPSIVQGLEAGADDYVTKPFSTAILTARIKNLIDLRRHFQLTLYREMTRQPVKMSLSQIDREFIKDLQEVIEKNLPDPDFNVEQMGKKLYMSRATLYRKIHALSGESPGEFIQSYRLKRGAELLKTNSATILEIALEVGFSSASYFTKCFKKKFNQLPSEYQGS